VFLTVLGAVMVAAWSIRSAWWVAVPVAAGLAFAAGTGILGFRLAVSETWFLVAAAVYRLAGHRLRRSAGNADAWLGAAREQQSRAAVAAARDRDRREQERVIHDTVLNTLTGIGWGGGDEIEQARRRCERSTAAVRRLLAGCGGDDRDDGDGGTAAGFDRRIEAVIADATRAGLDVVLSTEAPDTLGEGVPGGGVSAGDVTADVGGAVPAGAGTVERVPVGTGGSARARTVTGVGPPAEVSEAVAAALGEVLSNVRRHARTTSAWVTVSCHAGGGVRVETRDDGVGFDPDRCGPDRLGLRESVAGRLTEVGGSAAIQSSPGAGTTVVLSWRPAERPGEPPGTPSSTPEVPLKLPAMARRLRQDYAAGLRRTVSIVVAGVQLLLLLPLAASWHRYPAPSLAMAMWLVLAATATPAAWVLWRRALYRREAAAVVLVAIAGAVAMGFGTRPEDVTRTVNWFGVDAVPVLLTVVASSRPVREWVPAALLTNAVVLSVGVGRAGTDPVVLIQLFAASYGVWTILIQVATMGPVLRSTAETTTRAAEAEAELAARREAAGAVSRDRQRRHQHLDKEILPLLRGIAEGTADPRTDVVRQACATQAALLRRRLGTSLRPGRLGRLEAVVEAAEACGVAVEVQLAGDLTDAPTAVRAEIIDTVDEALDAAPGGPALLTVLSSDTGGSVYVSFPAAGMTGAPFVPVPGGGTRLTEVRADVTDGHACLEVHWRHAPAGLTARP
jgi:hypothetical protein